MFTDSKVEYLTNTTSVEGQRSILTPPYFDGTNYIQWKEHMKIFIQSVDFKLWLVIKNGPNIPKKLVEGQEVEKSEDEFDDEDMKNVGQDSKAKNILYCAINPDTLERISNCQTAKQIWDELEKGTTIANESLTTDPPPHLTAVNSAKLNLPIDDFLMETREAMDNYFKRCVPLHKLALEGNWPVAKLILETDPRLKHAAITRGWGTVLHVAAGASASEAHVHFVQELLGLLDNDHIALQDLKGNTAFCFAAAAGNMPVVELLLQRNPFLPRIPGGGGVYPIQFAALQGRCEMAQYLYELTTPVFEDQDWELLFLTCINTGNYGLALQMAIERPTLAFARDSEHDETALHLLAQKPLDSCCQSEEHHFSKINPVMKVCSLGMKQRVDLQLVKFLWNTILSTSESKLEIMEIINKPFQLLFVAVEFGNFGFLSELISAYPSLIWESDERNRSIIHIAVMNRHASIYNLIHEIGAQKDIIVTYHNSIDNNTLLHLAAKLAPPSRLELVSGAAFQMCFELSWFEEVKKIMPPSFIKMKNSEGLTASELFTRDHVELRKKADSWMKSIAENCMLISTVIATGVFSAAITLPGGSDSIGKPNFLGKTPFLVFAISDAAAFVLSATAILIFLSILVSRYAEYDFYKSLPLKLICGLVTLFFSIISMMIAFGSAFFITYYCYHGSKWVPSFISVFACVPVFLFIFLQFSLWTGILYSTYYCRNVFKLGKRMLYVLEK